MTGEPVSRRQIAEQLARCARYDGRTLDPQTFEDWYALLSDLPGEDIEDAVTVWYRTDRRWIMPADIVAHHEKLAAARQVEQARQSPPGCWGCDQVYQLSSRPGSKFALPAGPHDPGCRAYKGVLVFDGAEWNVMRVDPATFNEELWEQAHRAVTTRCQAYLELEG